MRDHDGVPTPIPAEARRRVADLLAAARGDGRRRILGLVGGPGAGKSSMAGRLGASDPGIAVVGMDGWHLAASVLDRLGRTGRKGAPDTFDADGYVAFLERVRATRDATVWAPEYRRSVEEPVAGALAVPPDADLVITEGNYLLLERPPWDRVRPLLDEAWFLAPDDGHRRARLIARHEKHGRTRDEAVARADGSDAENARLIAATAERADVVWTV